MEQVIYRDRHDKLAADHENYWEDIEWICGVLELQLRNCPTIFVSHACEEFGSPRVHATLGSRKLIKEEHSKRIENISTRNIEYLEWKNYSQSYDHEGRPWRARLFKTEGEFPIPKPTLKEFSERCYVRDAKHYRTTYLELIKMFPQYRTAITDNADWFEYLFETEEKLDEHFDKRIEHNKNNYDESFSWSLEERVADLERGRELAKKVSGWDE